MSGGYVKFYRKILNSGLLQNGPAWQLFGYLLLSASHKPCKRVVGGAVVDLCAGDVLFGRHRAAADLNLSEKQVRTALELLKNMGVVASRTASKYTVVSFVNWSSYQGRKPEMGQQVGMDEGTETGTEMGQQVGMDEGHKTRSNNKARRNTTPPLPPSQGEVCVSAEADVSASSPADHLHTSPAIAFEELRQRYSEVGRAEGPRSGLTEFIQLFGRNHGPAALEPVFSGMEAWAKSGQWQRGFAPGLARFLRERLWESPPPVEREKAESLPQIADVRYYAKTYGVQGLERYCSDHRLNPEPYRAACAPELLLHSEVRQEAAVC